MPVKILQFELHFTESTKRGLELAWTKFIYLEDASSAGKRKEVVSGSHQREGRFDSRFDWKKGIKGLSLLFLYNSIAQLRREKPFVLNNTFSDCSAALYDAVRVIRGKESDASKNKSAWFTGMFVEISCFGFERDREKVWLDENDWKNVTIKIFRDNSEETDPFELERIACQIEGKEPPRQLNAELEVLLQDARTGLFSPVDHMATLRYKDKIQLIAKVNQPAYIFLALIDQTRRTWHLYPWKPGFEDWSKDVELKKADEKKLPQGSADSAFTVKGSAGLETAVLMVTQTKPSAEQLARLPELLLAASATGTKPDGKGSSSGMRFWEPPDSNPPPPHHQAIQEKLKSSFEVVKARSFRNAGP